MINHLQALARDAGAAIMQYHADGFDVTRKIDGSPVTLADQASEDIIIDGLRRLTPDIPIIAEEQAEAGNAPDVAVKDTFWLVDPLDGTKEFIKGTNDFTINIGMVKNGMPVFGLVYLPATGDLYYGGEGIGAFYNDQKISARHYDPNHGLIVVGSKDHADPEKQARFLKGHQVASYVSRGSSLKFCMIADGQADLYPRFVPTYEWDTAAAHALLLQVGADIIDVDTGKRLSYGKRDVNYLNGYLVTATKEVLNLLL